MFKQNKFAAARKETKRLIGDENILADEASLLLHAYDCSLGKTRPDAVLKITSPSQIAPLIKILNKYSVPFTARSAATNHVGGCVTLNGGAVLNLTPLNKILEINTEVMLEWGKIRALTTRTLPVADSLIAAAAITHHMVLLTRNVKDFEDIEGINLINPWEF